MTLRFSIIFELFDYILILDIAMYALIEFVSAKREVEVVNMSTLRYYDADAKLPMECICDWKAPGSKKMKSYSVLRIAGLKFIKNIVRQVLDCLVIAQYPNKIFETAIES